jgi:hypothetical protein
MRSVPSIRSRFVPGCVLAAFSAIAVGAREAHAQVDLTAGFQTASSQLSSYVKTGITLAGLICTVVSLGMGAWKFMNKDPHAVWYLVGVVAGGVLFGVARGVM